MLIRVYLPNAPCPSSVPINEICEIKANGELKSSEGTGCETVLTPEDTPWFPPSAIGNRATDKSSFLALTKYSNQCDKASTFEQNLFLADGNCYAVEGRNSFFKASCSGATGDLQICNDSKCTVVQINRIAQPGN